MLFRQVKDAVYIEATYDELEYFKHTIGVDDIPLEDLMQDDINHLASSICEEVFYNVGSDVPLIQSIAEEWNGEELAVEMYQTNVGARFKICPLSKYSGPTPDMFERDLNNIFKKNRKRKKETTMDIGDSVRELLKNDDNMHEFLNDTITDDFIDSAIKSYLTTIYEHVQDMPIEIAAANLLKSDLCHAFVAKGLEEAIKENETIDMAETTRVLLLKFMDRIKELYKGLRIETFYRVNCLDDALKAMIYVPEGCIIKVKDKYYLVTLKDNLIYTDFGTKVDRFCYTDESIICRIKNGTFDTSEKNKEK